MNPKIDKISNEIDKTKGKISEFQARLRELEKQKNEIENTDIVAAVRSANIDHQELLAFIHAYRSQGAAAETMLGNRPGQEEQEDFDNDED